MRKILPVFLFSALLALPMIAFAQVTDPAVIACTLINKVKVVLVVIGVGIGVIMLIAGGIIYVTAGGSPEKASTARRLIINAIIGLAIVFAAVFILALVQNLLTGGGISIIGNPCVITYEE